MHIVWDVMKGRVFAGGAVFEFGGSVGIVKNMSDGWCCIRLTGCMYLIRMERKVIRDLVIMPSYHRLMKLPPSTSTFPTKAGQPTLSLARLRLRLRLRAACRAVALPGSSFPVFTLLFTPC